MTTTKVELPPKLIPVFSGDYRYRGAFGGRGSGKTRNFAFMLAVRGLMFAEMGVSGVLLGGREFMNTLSDSSMEEIKQAIRSEPWLDAYYEIGENYIRTKNRLVWFAFAGLRHNLDSIKSKARILIAWVDEAESVSDTAWSKLIPTVRDEGVAPNGQKWHSEIWVTWNPEKKGSPVDKRFRGAPDDDMCIVEMNYHDNPWFPSVLEAERQRDQRNLDDETYQWIWEGAYLENSESVVFKNKYEIREFEPTKAFGTPYQGLDFGFSNDPTAAVRCYIHDDCLWIRHDASKVGLELDDTIAFLEKRIPDVKRYRITADNARPESISYLKRHGLNKIEACKKGKGSIEDGISYIKQFRRVYIHPDCQATIDEFRNYSYKVDRLTGEVLPDMVDDHNHVIDALRYALEKARGGVSTLSIL